MNKNTVISFPGEGEPQAERDALEEILRQGARKLLHQALENEIAEYIEAHQHEKDEHGHRQVVRNGHLPERKIVTGIGQISIHQPRVNDRREGCRFSSSILPPFMRRTPSVDTLIPVLYLKGISTGDFSQALSAILGENASGLSATNIVRLKEQWKEEYQQWSQRDLSEKHYVYIWADGIYFNVRLDADRPCLLVLMGTLADGSKELIAIGDGERESKLSWKELLVDLKQRGLKEMPKLAIGDGALGFWAALEEIAPETRQQRCWVHKTANILDKLPKKVQPGAKRQTHEMYMAPTRDDAIKAYEKFLAVYEAKYPKACECLRKDREVLFTFYDFPAEHWVHIRTTNPIESTFSTVRLRTRRTKGCGSREATLMMVYKLAREAEKRWRKIRGFHWIPQVLKGILFQDGVIPVLQGEEAI